MGSWMDRGPREPTLQEQRAGAPEQRPHRSRKDRKRWCGGHVGREHVPTIRLSKWGRYWADTNSPHAGCKWIEKHHWEFTLTSREWVGTGEYRWRCRHEVGCERCGKVLGGQMGVGRRCPDFHERG